MPPKFYFTTKSELAEEERKRFLKEVEELPPTAPLRQDLSAFLPATRDNTTTTSPYEQSQQTISQERYIKEQDRKRTALSGRTYGENKFIREGGNAIASGIMEMSPIGDARDVATAIEDPSLTNIGVAGLAMLPVVGKGLKKVAKGVKAVDSAKNLQKLDNAIIKNNPEMEKVFMPPPKNAAKTQRAGTLPTYMKAVKILDEISSGGKMIDFSSGLGIGARYARKGGMDAYEPFHDADKIAKAKVKFGGKEYVGGKQPDFTKAEDIPSESYEKLINLNTLNVVGREDRDKIIKDIGRVLKPGGTGIVMARTPSDVMGAKGVKGKEPNSIITGTGTYQKGFTQEEIVDYVSSQLGDGFSVEPLTSLNGSGVIIKKKTEMDKVFKGVEKDELSIGNKYSNKMVELFGTTKNISDSGFLLKDGTLVDMGRSVGKEGKGYTYHSDAAKKVIDSVDNVDIENSQAWYDFIRKSGAVRLDADASGEVLNFNFNPSSLSRKQKKVIVSNSVGKKSVILDGGRAGQKILTFPTSRDILLAIDYITKIDNSYK